MSVSSSASLRSAIAEAAESQIQHGVFVADDDRRPFSPQPSTISQDLFNARLPRRLESEDDGFLVELPNGTLVGTHPRAQPREPTPEETYIGQLDRDDGLSFLVALSNAYGIELEKVLVPVASPKFLTDLETEEGDLDDDDKPERKILKIAPEIMQTLSTAVWDLTSAFQDTDLYPFPSIDKAKDILSYVIHTDDGGFTQAFLQLASAESRQKAYFQPKFEQYVQNAALIKHQKMNIFETLSHHHWNPEDENFYPNTEPSLGQAGYSNQHRQRTVYL